MDRMWLRKGKTKQIFDYILFNPPYLPDESDPRLNDIALNAGKIGTEVIERFLKSFKGYLKPNGKALIIVSSIIVSKFLALLDKHKIHFLLIDKKGLFYEELYCYQIW
jgi:methylase of polypeptide subunit release factors